ncbi:MAG: MarC family protein [Pseudomonadota bacterium]
MSPGITSQFILVTTVSIFTIVNPLGATPLFASHVTGLSKKERHRMARRASATCALILLAFAVAGQGLLQLMGISIPALRIAGAALVFVVALDMIRGANIRSRTLPEEQKEAAEKHDISIIPLAVPLLSGPGAITTVIILMSHSKGWVQDGVVCAAIIFVSILTFFILSGSLYFLRWIGPSGVRVMNRLMGLILAAIAAQFVINGIKDLLPEFSKLT